jgi:hypothetical protein
MYFIKNRRVSKSNDDCAVLKGGLISELKEECENRNAKCGSKKRTRNEKVKHSESK